MANEAHVRSSLAASVEVGAAFLKAGVDEIVRLEAEIERLRAALERIGHASIEEITFSDDDRVVLSCRLCGWSNRWRQSEAAWHAPDCVLAE